MSMKEKFVDQGLSYKDALHGMQSGVGWEHEQGSRDKEPKHLRTGINSCFINAAAMFALLVDKGIITEEEFDEYLRLAANDEVTRYEMRNLPMVFR